MAITLCLLNSNPQSMAFPVFIIVSMDERKQGYTIGRGEVISHH